MSKYFSKSAPVSDMELLHKTIIYLTDLCPNLPFSRLQDHCKGAVASLFELLFYLKLHDLKDYGNN